MCVRAPYGFIRRKNRENSAVFANNNIWKLADWIIFFNFRMFSLKVFEWKVFKSLIYYKFFNFSHFNLLYLSDQFPGVKSWRKFLELVGFLIPETIESGKVEFPRSDPNKVLHGSWALLEALSGNVVRYSYVFSGLVIRHVFLKCRILLKFVLFMISTSVCWSEEFNFLVINVHWSCIQDKLIERERAPPPLPSSLHEKKTERTFITN